MLGLVEREAYLFMHVLHLNVDVSFKIFVYGTGREEARAEETSDRRQA